MVIIKVLIGGIEPVNSPSSLGHNLIAITLAEEHDCVCLDAIPSFSASIILNKVGPISPLRNLLMLMAIPLGKWNIFRRADFDESIQLVIVVVKYNDPRMKFHDFNESLESRRIKVYKLS